MADYAVVLGRICQAAKRYRPTIAAAWFVGTGLSVLASVVPGAAAQAPTLPDTLVPRHQARVVEVVDGDTLLLDDGGEVRLVGIQAPKLPLGRPGFQAWPLAEESRQALVDAALDREVGLAFGGREEDRYGRLLAHLVRDDGVWLQGLLLAQGMARVYSFPDNRTAVAEMLAIEREARAAGVGLWADPFYAIRSPEAAGDYLDTFQLVEGRIVDAATVRGRVYLNFGADWRDDFTVSISAGDVEPFLALGIDFESLIGQRIRVRGWLYRRNGPMIDATHPEQVEILPD